MNFTTFFQFYQGWNISDGTHIIITGILIFYSSVFDSLGLAIPGWNAMSLENLFGHLAAILKAIDAPWSYPAIRGFCLSIFKATITALTKSAGPPFKRISSDLIAPTETFSL